jgi:hypothetical protein
MLRYLSGRIQARKTQQQQEQQLLEEILGSKKHEYGELLRIVQSYPVEVIRNCHDSMGNTVLQLVLSQNSRRRRSTNEHEEEEAKKEIVAENPSPQKSRWRLLRAANAVQPEETKEDKNVLVKLLHYLVHCTDPEMEEGHGQFGAWQHRNNRNASRYNSLVRMKSASGSLPLHTACRCVIATTANDDDEQQHEHLDAVEYLMQAYPIAVQCPDSWGNLPLHDACDASSVVRLEVILLLVQQWPQSVRTPNLDGDLPLHLAAAAQAVDIAMDVEPDPTDMLVRQNQNCSDELKDAADYSNTATICSSRSVAIELPEQAPIKPVENANLRQRRLRREQQQLEIVQYLVDYWPESVHHTNNQGQTPLQRAIAGNNSNSSVIGFLQAYAQTCQVGSLPVLMTLNGTSSSSNPFDDEPSLHGSNPFDDESVEDANGDNVATGINPFNDVPLDNHEDKDDDCDQLITDNNCEEAQLNAEKAYGTNTGSTESPNAIESKESEGAGLQDTSMDGESTIARKEMRESKESEGEGSQDTSMDDESSIENTENSVGVELVEDFQVVVEENEHLEHSLHMTDVLQCSSVFEMNEATTLEQHHSEPMNELSNTIPFDHNSMSAIG